MTTYRSAEPSTTYRTPRKPVYVSKPLPLDDQDAMRTRRRQHLRVLYTGSFDLAAEVSAICAPLAEQLAALPDPLVLRGRVLDVADAVHEVLSAVVGMLAESKHLDAAAQARTAHAVADLARRPHEPEITDAMLADGTWAHLLTTHVQPFTADFAAFLDRCAPPDAAGLRGNSLSASERLEAVLRVLDDAALHLSHFTKKAARRQAMGSFADHQRAQQQQRDAAAVAQRLAKLGLAPDTPADTPPDTAAGGG